MGPLHWTWIMVHTPSHFKFKFVSLSLDSSPSFTLPILIAFTTSHMEFDSVKFDDGKALGGFNCFRATAKLGQLSEVLLLSCLISWSSACAPALFRTAAAYAVDFSTYLFNHHVVFIVGNCIIASLLLLCGRNAAAAASLSYDDCDLYDDYVKHSDAAAAAEATIDQREPAYDLPPPSPTPIGGGGEGEKQIVTRAEEIAAVAIEKATRQIKWFEQTQSEKLRREITVAAAQRALRWSETENRPNSVSCGERLMRS